MDILIENNRKDKIFLKAWLKYFCDYKLKGQKMLKIKWTSMKMFKDSFSEFALKFNIPHNFV